MAFEEDMSVFMDTENGFAVTATLDGSPVSVIFDAPGVDVLDGAVATTEPSALIQASIAAAVGDQLVLSGGDLPAQLAHHAGTYGVINVTPEAPDGAMQRLTLQKAA
jgi:hypothetical protein